MPKNEAPECFGEKNWGALLGIIYAALVQDYSVVEVSTALNRAFVQVIEEKPWED